MQTGLWHCARYTRSVQSQGGRVGNEVRLADRSLTLRLRRDAFLQDADKQRATDSAKALLSDAFKWTRDDRLMQQLCGLLGIGDASSADAVFKVKRAIETGDIVAIPDAPRYTGAGSGGSGNPKPRSVTFTPSQLFKGTARIARAGSYVARPLPRLPAEDGPAIWAANPGDVLPDGSIATPLAEFTDTAAPDLADAQPFEYAPDETSGNLDELAARGVGMSGNEPGGHLVNPNGRDVDYFDSEGNLCAQFHASHGEPHGHNFFNGKRDNTHLPMSPINCE
ncbi:hypothetical protein GCT13_15800 [Paraburkholderia sp. CNPSo 3157]|uniref:Uncharacterized protein n=1 Tax=Paraburkholderia franconis TaxID=2654983 RepID=A0A7X1NB37_9BURK|nr:hypothetical protein [Paraburkholderia franconis]MPW18336.1 hypothetical protein [Paraburkholderia franconis]